MSGIFRYIPGICQPISHTTRYMSRICLTYSFKFRVISSLLVCLEYSRHIPRIFFPSHLVICLEYTWITIVFLCLRIGPGLKQQCDWDATAVTVHELWVSRVFNNPFPKPIEYVASSAKWNVHIWNRLWKCSSRLYAGTLTRKTPGLQRSNFRRLKINLKSSGGDLLLEHF